MGLIDFSGLLIILSLDFNSFLQPFSEGGVLFLDNFPLRKSSSLNCSIKAFSSITYPVSFTNFGS